MSTYTAVLLLLLMSPYYVLAEYFVSGCDSSCKLSIVESIPENLTYSAGSPIHYSTYQGWMDLLAAARTSVDIASYYWTLQGRGKVADVTDKEGEDVFQALSSLRSNGVALRIVQNPSNSIYHNLDSKILQEKGLAKVQCIDIERLIGDGILHTKLWVVDRKHFYLGSANMDWRSLTQVKELGLVGMDCECLGLDVQRLFDVYWYLSTPGNTLPPHGHWPSQFSALYNKTSPASTTVNRSLTSDIYFASSPPKFCAAGRSNDIEALVNVINMAHEFVYVAVMDYAAAVVFIKHKRYWGVIDDALRAAAYRGVTVRLLASYWEHTDDDMIRFMKSLSDDSMMGYKGLLEMRLFRVPSLTTKSVPYTRVNHNKYMVTDAAAYIGTSNWSGDYFINTGGISCTVSSKNAESAESKPTTAVPIQQQLKEVFERDWNSAYSYNITSIHVLL